MLFNEPRFLIFLLIVWVIAWKLRNNSVRKIFLLLASYFFYSCWDWRFLGLILGASLTSWCAANGINRNEHNPVLRRLWLILGIGTGLGALFFFKYFDFFLDSLSSILTASGRAPLSHNLQIILPVGISFFTFHCVSYVLDAYMRRARPTASLPDYLLYVAFFPHLVAGPIVRANDFVPQLSTLPQFGVIRWRPVLTLFMLGFFKKAVLSDNLAPYVDAFFQNPQLFTATDSLLATVLYAVQIYCDFSGYSDMGIAVAAFFGYRLCVNFDHPYFSINIAEFWRRWHISLSSWLRDYLYIPLGGNRGGEAKTLRNLMVTMVLGGIWHGAAWTFIIWGALHGFGLVVHRLWVKYRPLKFDGGLKILSWSLTFSWVLVTWIFFRSTSLDNAVDVLNSLLSRGQGTAGLPSALWCHLVVLAGFHGLTWKECWVDWVEKLPGWCFVLAFGAFVTICLVLVPNGYRPFIYFQF